MKKLMEQFGWSEPLLPMNAKDPKTKLEGLFKDDNYVAELKFDGSRYLCIGTPEGGRFFSRKKSENKKSPETLGMPVEKTANVPHLSEAFKDMTFIVDGEVFYPGKKSNNVTSIMGCDPEKAIARQKGEHGLIHYMMYDILYYGGQDVRHLPWSERRSMLVEIHGTHFLDNEHIHLSETAYGEYDKRQLLKWAEENGEEGIMLKNIDAKYQSDKRPEHHWYKVKGEITMDVVVMGFEEGEGKYANMIGSIIFGLYKEVPSGTPPTVEATSYVLTKAGTCSGMTDELRKELTDDWNYGSSASIGKVMEIKAMERTEKGLFRHPRFIQFRSDKNAMDCLWDNEIDN